MTWENAELSLIAEIGDGAHASLKRVKSGIPYLTAKNITKNGISYSNIDFISEETYEKYFKEKSNALTKPQKNDILYSIIGSIGGVYCVKDEKIGISSSVAIIRANSELIFPQYLAYFLKSKFFEAQVQAIKGGVAQGFMSIEKLKNVNILYPKNLDYQAKIVSILSAYDDLIENNQKQIKLLEEAAQRLYKEWFVDLHFPGYETTPIIDGVPKGWEKEFLTNLVDVQYGYAFNGAFFNNTGCGMPIVRIRNIPEGQTMDFTTEEASKEYIIHNGDILVGMDGDFHINTWGGKDAYLVQRTCSLRPKFNYMKGYLLQAIVEPIKYFEKTVVGATVAHLGKKHIDTIKIFKAPVELYRPFQIWYEKRQSLINQNRLLVEARDRLLPKLMNGELKV